MLWLCWRTGIQHDYRSYIGQWRLLMDGADPWSTDNTYGPIHTLIGYLLFWHTLAPKSLIVMTLLIANIALAVELFRARGVAPVQIVYLLAIPTNVLIVGVGVIYGLNDALVAALVVAAVLFRHRLHYITAGSLLGLAALIKFYPILLLPFFALEKERLRWSVMTSGIATFCIGLFACVAIWGLGPIGAMFFGSRRGPKLLSVLASLQSVFGQERVILWLIKYNTMFVLSGVIFFWFLSWQLRLNWLVSAVIGYLVVLTAYKVGHQQFYLPWLFMVASLPLLKEKPADRIAAIFVPIILLLSLYHFGYEFGSDGYHDVLGSIRAYGGFIAFTVSVISISTSLIYLYRYNEIRQRCIHPHTIQLSALMIVSRSTKKSRCLRLSLGRGR